MTKWPRHVLSRDAWPRRSVNRERGEIREERLRLQDEIWQLMTQKSDERVYTNAIDSVAYAHMAVAGLTKAVLRLASEVEDLQRANRANASEAEPSRPTTQPTN